MLRYFGSPLVAAYPGARRLNAGVPLRVWRPDVGLEDDEFLGGGAGHVSSGLDIMHTELMETQLK